MGNSNSSLSCILQDLRKKRKLLQNGNAASSFIPAHIGEAYLQLSISINTSIRVRFFLDLNENGVLFGRKTPQYEWLFTNLSIPASIPA